MKLADSSGGTATTGFPLLRINLGGEGEVPNVINQQRWALNTTWRTSQTGQTLHQQIAQGHPYLLCENTSLPFPAASVDEVITNNVPIDVNTWLGPGVQSSEIRRILKSGANWIDNNVVVYTKP